MKKKLTIIIAIIALICCAVIFVACSDNDDEKARNAELQNIALSTVKAQGHKVQYASVTRRNSNNNYVVEVVIEGVKYDVTIDENKNVVSVKINDHQVDKDQVPLPPYSQNNIYIGDVRAREIAYADAGVTEAEITKLEVEFDFDDGKYLYEVEFRVGATKYEYDIDALSGAIHKKEVNEKTVISTTPDGVEFIGVDRAIEIALANANVGEADVTVTKAKLDYDNGAYVYEIEFENLQNEYEYEINAVTGAVIKMEIEGVEHDEGILAGEYINVEEAKRIALSHAGFTLEQVNFEKAELEIEHGVVIYEVEFKVGGYEYEYEINATTGSIISRDVEIDD